MQILKTLFQITIFLQRMWRPICFFAVVLLKNLTHQRVIYKMDLALKNIHKLIEENRTIPLIAARG